MMMKYRNSDTDQESKLLGLVALSSRLKPFERAIEQTTETIPVVLKQ